MPIPTRTVTSRSPVAENTKRVLRATTEMTNPRVTMWRIRHLSTAFRECSRFPVTETSPANPASVTPKLAISMKYDSPVMGAQS